MFTTKRIKRKTEMIKKEPKFSIKSLVGYLIIYLGYLLFLIGLHLCAITSSNPNTASVMNTTFMVFLVIYVGMIFFGFAGIVIKLLTWLTYQATTPKWLRK